MTPNTDTQPQCLPEAEHKRYGRLLIGLTLAGVLFMAGQGVRLWQETQRTRAVESALADVYRRALGGVAGRSPYGRLQFELGKLQAESAQRLDLLELLAALSRHAPEGVRIRSLSMASQSGVVAGIAGDAQDFERYKAALAAEGAFVFSVRQADAYAVPMPFELDVKVRDRAAPPLGEDQ